MQDLNKLLRGVLESDADLNETVARISMLRGVPRAKLSLELAKRAFGNESDEALRSLRDLAGEHLALGDYEAAEALLRQVLQIWSLSATVDEEHADFATSIGNLASVVLAQGRFLEAEEIFRQSIKFDSGIRQRNPIEYAVRLSNLAEAIKAQGRLDEAEHLYRQVLALQIKSNADFDVNRATSLNNLAGVVNAQGRIEEAYELWSQALEIYRDKLGDRHRYTAITASQLFSLLLAHSPDDPEIPALQALLDTTP